MSIRRPHMNRSYQDDDVETGNTHQHGHSQFPHPTGDPAQSEGAANSSLASDDTTFSAEPNRAFLFSVSIFLIGCIASAAFLSLGITSAERDQDTLFNNRGIELVRHLDSVWKGYEIGALWIHEECRRGNNTHKSFADMYQHLIASGIEFQAATFIPNITHDERERFESEAYSYYREIAPDFNYRGILGFEPDQNGNLTVQPRSNQSYYFPIQYVEPFKGNEASVYLDVFSSSTRKATISLSIDRWQPVLTERLRLVQETEAGAYSVILYHPGIPLPSSPHPQDLAGLVVRLPALLLSLSMTRANSIAIYMYDSTNINSSPQFLCGAIITVVEGNSTVKFSEEIELAALVSSSSRFLTDEVDLFSRKWTVVIVALDGTYEPQTVFVIWGAAMFLLVGTCLAVWVYMSIQRMSKINKLKSASRAEKAALIVENARKSAKAESDLNDLIAHEVRNPLAAAISACTFVSSSLSDDALPLLGAESHKLAQQDLHIIHSSLHFINDLLRNLLDMQRAASNQLNIEKSPVDVLRDVFEPVDSMLYRRGENFQVILDCPPNLYVMGDSLRLKQIALNLSRNSATFVDHGFIRLKAAVVDGFVQLSVEDSGPGISEEEHENLFARFQDSLDSLNQGMGIGLCLCKNLAEIMDGEIFLDKTYDSGISGCPGTRFVLKLNVPPLNIDDCTWDIYAPSRNSFKSIGKLKDDEHMEMSQQELPENLSILFVDDDLVLRKLFSRAVKRVAPSWNIQEASNGETALRLVDSEKFDLIFIDQYMASADKQLLGTETARALRAKGVTSHICGLSANDMMQSFLGAGANSFMSKPFPCEQVELKHALFNMLLTNFSPCQVKVTSSIDASILPVSEPSKDTEGS